MKRKILLITIPVLVSVAIFLVFKIAKKGSDPAETGYSFHYPFNFPGTLEETEFMDESPSPYFWLNSGGLLQVKNDIGMTVQGNLNDKAKWRYAYAETSRQDTDNGYHPQNLFRLLTRSKWQDFAQEASFRVAKDQLSDSENRNESNGLLLFNRYQDSDNLYYTGLRVDGGAVIKKKYKGRYYTMALNPFLTGNYDKSKKISLLPKNNWIGIRSVVQNTADGRVSIKLFIDNGLTGNWILAAEAIDDGIRYGGPAILEEGYGGIRTDFMDVHFDDLKITKIGD
ncbi:hypothetical protein C4572_01665 [Candidatus Parcubacteria bacterium]|nr:MAG: hypothetical protein C4572_01665 [Candidatus Parcubacteria bacterium]